jgi:hypothetical protein
MSSATKLTPLSERLPNPDFEEFARDCIRLAGHASLRDPTAAGHGVKGKLEAMASPLRRTF